jgi:hypothetical protein
MNPHRSALSIAVPSTLMSKPINGRFKVKKSAEMIVG